MLKRSPSSPARLARTLTVLLAVVAQVAAANAQDTELPSDSPLTLARALELARSSSPELVAARDAVAAAAARRRQAGAFPNPTLSYDREQASHQGTTSAQDIVSVGQPLDIGGLRGARVNAARLRFERAEAELQAAESQLVFDVTRAYALALAADRRAALAQNATTAFGRAERIGETRLAAGDVSGYAVRRIRLEAARYATVRAEAQLAQRATRLVLASYLDSAAQMHSASALELSDSETFDAPALSPDALRAMALQHRAELRVAALDAQAFAADVRVASRQRVPIPVVFAGLKNERISNGESLAGFVAGVSLPLPLWDRRGGAIDAAQADASRQLAEAEVVRRRVVREVAEAVESLRAADEQLAILRPQLGAESSSALRAAQLAYAEGEITLVEWLDAVRAYQEAESAFASLSAEWRIQLAALERAVGAPLSRNDR